MKMRLLFVLAATLALSLAESEQNHFEDLEAAESIELQKTHDLEPSASAYNPVPYSSWNQPQYVPPQINNNQQPYVPPFGSAPPTQYIPGFPPRPVQSDYPYNPAPTPVTTTPVPVIKNEQYIGNDGSYRYEYQLADGTWVAEQGWVVPGPKGEEGDVVKKGWYQYKANDGKIYTVTYWADHTGYHAYGAHLPVAPPTPPAIQASLDQQAKEEAAKAEAGNNRPYYTSTSRPVYHDSPQQPQYPPQPQYPSQPQYSSQPQYTPPQSQYPQPPQPYYPPAQPQPYYPQTK